MLHTISDVHGRVSLYPLKLEHIEEMRIIRNKNRMCFIYSDIITEKEQIQWYNRYITKNDDYMFSIIRNNDNKFIGAVGLYDITDKVAEFGRLMIDKEIVNEKGFGCDVLQCICKIGFDQLNLEKISLEVFEDNLPAYKTYIRAGFMTCGKSQVNDKIILNMSLTKKEYLKEHSNG